MFQRRPIPEGRQEGRQEGLQEGIQKGLRQQRYLLLRLLELRFGTLSPAVRQRVEELGPEEVERVADRVVTASSLEEVGLG